VGFKPKLEAGRPALLFGEQKINVHQADYTFDPKARHPTVGGADSVSSRANLSKPFVRGLLSGASHWSSDLSSVRVQRGK
jgi:hypothetical protein